MLKDKTIWTGYLFDYRNNNSYSKGSSFDTLNYYRENGDFWKKVVRKFYYIRGDYLKGDVAHRSTLDEVVPNKNMYRHIYKQNILAKHHLEEKFDGLSLTEWIDKNNYGNIEKIGSENWLWIVPDEKLQELQIIFYKKGLLIGVE